jgi:hypothetical protein
MNSQETSQCQSHFIGNELFGRLGRLQTNSLLLTALLSLLVVLAWPADSFAQLALTDDANTSTAPKSTNSNFGTNPNLSVSASGNVYLKFKLSSTLPADTPASEVERATLKLYLANIMTAGKLDVYAVAGPWDESMITADNAPPLGSLVTTTAQIGTDRRHKFLVVDVTALVQQWLGDDGQGTNGLPNHGIVLIAHPTDATTPEVASIIFDSKENSQTSHEAQLNIQLDLAADGLQKVEHDASLTGNGTSALPLGVANGGINSLQLAIDSVTSEKLANNAVTSTELADGAVTSPKITAPLSLTSANANFTLSAANTGAGAAITATGAINTTSQYNLNGQRILSNAGTNNLFAGVNTGTFNVGQSNSFFGSAAGIANTTGNFSSFFGSGAGRGNTGGSNNSFFGSDAGLSNTTGFQNSFFGREAGVNNTEGSFNSFFGRSAGLHNTTGAANNLFGQDAGILNTTGGLNTFFGNSAGHDNTTGNSNAFFGVFAGDSNATGSNNTAIGRSADVGANNLMFATAIGSGAVVNTSNTIVLGRSADTVQIPGTLNASGVFGANIVNSTTQFNLGGNRILSIAGTSNLFAGIGAGAANTGTNNSFFGINAGQANGTGGSHSFFGSNAGRLNTAFCCNSFFGTFAGAGNTIGTGNSFFGASAGEANSTGLLNSFFGTNAGRLNTTANSNAFFGHSAGERNTGGGNAFFGTSAGQINTTGFANAFFGDGAGIDNTIGSNITVIGSRANVGADNLTNATAIGANAQVEQSNSLVLGGIIGVNGGANTNVGIGTTAPKTKLHVTNGKIYVEANGQGVILKAPGGACFELTVTNAGALTTTPVACP